MNDFLKIEGLTAGYDPKTVLHDISFSLAPATLNCILGPNGSGKSTLLRAIAQQLAHEGRCLLRGAALEDASARAVARKLSFVPQRSGIQLSLPILEVVRMGFNPWLGLLQSPNAAQTRRALRSLERVGLGERAQEDFQTLSEGQKQLVILARTLVEDAELILMDEPDSALDFENRYRMLNFMRGMLLPDSNIRPRAALICLHDVNLALDFCDQLILLRKGRVIASLHPKIDSIEKMQSALRELYGDVFLQRVTDAAGRARLVMLVNVGEVGAAAREV